jgi:hypothetical protein
VKNGVDVTLKSKSEFERQLRRILREQRLAKVDCYCHNWDGIELRDALLTQFNEVLAAAHHDFPPLHDLKLLLHQLDEQPEMARKALRQTIDALQKWFPSD